MNYVQRFCSVLSAILSISLSACAAGRAHENFENRMQRHVGRSAEDPNNSINRYPENRGLTRNLPNDNIEQEYRFAPGCQVYFEIDKATRKIVGWRYEGTEQECVVVP